EPAEILEGAQAFGVELMPRSPAQPIVVEQAQERAILIRPQVFDDPVMTIGNVEFRKRQARTLVAAQRLGRAVAIDSPEVLADCGKCAIAARLHNRGLEREERAQDDALFTS